ncbi:glycosyltransferase 25 family member [Culicoides brevitarsis]|uniref:glycosyltransferase 25 family member n=1 Tax=Culicoides brevitarsis TaxID=469753 RepID=UPI00307BA30A
MRVAFLVFLSAICVSGYNVDKKESTVLIAILIRNKAHILPYFFSYLESLDYPKDRISLWIRSDHNEDNSLQIIDAWLNTTRDLYHSVDYQFSVQPKRRASENSFHDWSNERFNDVIRLKEEALYKAKVMWADYIFFLDADVILTEPSTLRYLTSLKLPIVGPLLQSESLYSNFWGGMTPKYYYVRTEEYTEIMKYEKMGEFVVPMIHSAVLLDMRLAKIDSLTFNKPNLNKMLANSNQEYTGPNDDIITFAVSANLSHVPMYISNKKQFGHITVPLEGDETMAKDKEKLTDVLLSIVNELGDISIVSSMREFIEFPKKDRLEFSKIFMVNLVRRDERRKKMEKNFDLLGLEVEHFAAIDGKQMNEEWIKQQGIEFMPGFVDPYHDRPMTYGEIGCFMSHYLIWKKMVEEKLELVLILEDDVKFEPYFRTRVTNILAQARKSGKTFDLLYFGRKALSHKDERYIPGTTNLVEVGYSYWTLGYVLTLKGAQKLLAQEPQKKMVPVDEYLPIMFNHHPKERYKSQFNPRDLVAWSTAPLLLFPTHYTGDEGYISDTEQSLTIKVTNAKSDENANNLEPAVISDSKSIFSHQELNAEHQRTEL